MNLSSLKGATCGYSPILVPLAVIESCKCERPLRFVQFPVYLKLPLANIRAVREQPPFLQRVTGRVYPRDLSSTSAASLQ